MLQYAFMKCEIEEPYALIKWHPMTDKPSREKRYLLTVKDDWGYCVVISDYKDGRFSIPKKVFDDDDDDVVYEPVGWAKIPTPCDEHSFGENPSFEFKVDY